MRDESPGDLLKSARERLGLDPHRVARAINMTPDCILSLERDDLEAFPSPTYHKGFLRIYAEYLGLNFEQLLEKFEILEKQRAPLPEALLHKSVKPRLLIILIVIFGFLLVIAAGGWLFLR